MNDRRRARGQVIVSIAAVLALAVALAVGTVAVAGGRQMPTTHAAHAASARHGARAAKATFHDAMRKLWEDHVTWTRLFIVSAATLPADLPDTAATTDRLLANQVDIGNAIKPFYGNAAGDKLTSLLRTHILLAARLIAAAKAGDNAGVTTASTAWYANANEITAFLHAANPDHWALDDLETMMKSHLDLTLQEAVDRLGGHYAADVADYDRVHVEILEMADMLSDGIVAQFPQAFAS